MPQTARISVGANTRPLEADIVGALRRAERHGINLKFDTRGFNRPLGTISSDLKEFDKSLDASNARVLAFAASAGILYQIVGGFQQIVKTGVEVQKALADINVVLNVGSKELNGFAASLIDIAKYTGQSFSEVSKAAVELARQGLGAEETLRRTRDALILTRLTGLDAAESVQDLTAAINSFKNETLDSTKIVNTLATVDASFAVSSKDLAEAIKRVGSSADDAGVSFNQLIALVTSAQQTTARGGSVIGNALKTIFTRVERPEVLDQLQQLGVTVRDLGGETLPAISILEQLAQKLDGLTSAEKSQVQELLGGVFQINQLKAVLSDLSGQYSIYSDALRTASTAGETATRRTEELNKTTAALFNETAANFTRFASTIGQGAFEPAVRKALKLANTALTAFDTSQSEGIGSKIGEGIVKGLGNFIAGPGLALAFGLILRAVQRFAGDLISAQRTLLGLNDGLQKQAVLQKTITSVLLQNPQLLDDMRRGIYTNAQAEETVLQKLREELVLRERILGLSASFAASASNLGFTVSKGELKLSKPRTVASGYVPELPEVQERMQAREAGYEPGAVRRTYIKGLGKVYYNTAEQVKDFGFDQPAIMPPKASRAGVKYRERFKKELGFDPYTAAEGYAPKPATQRDRRSTHALFNEMGSRGYMPTSNNLYINVRQQVLSSNIIPNFTQRVNQYNENYAAGLPAELGQQPKDVIQAVNKRIVVNNTTVSGLQKLRIRPDADVIEEEISVPLNSLQKRYREVTLNPFAADGVVPNYNLRLDPRRMIGSGSVGDFYDLGVKSGGTPLGAKKVGDLATIIQEYMMTKRISERPPHPFITAPRVSGSLEAALQHSAIFKTIERGKDGLDIVLDNYDNEKNIRRVRNSIVDFSREQFRNSRVLPVDFENPTNHIFNDIAVKYIQRFAKKPKLVEKLAREPKTLDRVLRNIAKRGARVSAIDTELFETFAGGVIPNFVPESTNDKRIRRIIRNAAHNRRRVVLDLGGVEIEKIKERRVGEPARYSVATPIGSYATFNFEPAKKELNLNYIESHEKGGGTFLMERLVNYAKKRGLDLYSSSLVAQQGQPGVFGTFPQLKIRQKLGLEHTSAQVETNDDSRYFTQLSHLVDYLSTLKQSDLESAQIRDLKTRLRAQGQVPNFALFSRKTALALPIAAALIGGARSPRTVTRTLDTPKPAFSLSAVDKSLTPPRVLIDSPKTAVKLASLDAVSGKELNFVVQMNRDPELARLRRDRLKSDIKLEFTNNKANPNLHGMYYPDRDIIQLNTSTWKKDYTDTFFHEVGHKIDRTSTLTKKEVQNIVKAIEVDKANLGDYFNRTVNVSKDADAYHETFAETFSRAETKQYAFNQTNDLRKLNLFKVLGESKIIPNFAKSKPVSKYRSDANAYTRELIGLGYSEGLVPNFMPRVSMDRFKELLKTRKFKSFTYQKENGEVGEYNLAQWRVHREMLVGATPPAGHKSWTEFDETTGTIVEWSQKVGEDKPKFRRFKIKQIKELRAENDVFTLDNAAAGRVPNFALFNPPLKNPKFGIPTIRANGNVDYVSVIYNQNIPDERQRLSRPIFEFTEQFDTKAKARHARFQEYLQQVRGKKLSKTAAERDISEVKMVDVFGAEGYIPSYAVKYPVIKAFRNYATPVARGLVPNALNAERFIQIAKKLKQRIPPYPLDGPEKYGENYFEHPEFKARANAHRQGEQNFELFLKKAVLRGDIDEQTLANTDLLRAPEYKELGKDFDRFGQVTQLPKRLFHTTTNYAAVKASGVLKSRRDLAMASGTGLGGGPDETISFTDDRKVARAIQRSTIEFASLLSGKRSPAFLFKRAKEGFRATRPFIKDFSEFAETTIGKHRFEAIQTGMLTQITPFEPKTAEEISRLGGKPIEGFSNGKFYKYQLPFTPSQDDIRSLYSAYSYAQESAGGYLNPLFFTSDYDKIKEHTLKNVRIVEATPKFPTDRGLKVNALGEYRVLEGKRFQLKGKGYIPIFAAPPLRAVIRALQDTPATVVRVPKTKRDKEIGKTPAYEAVSDKVYLPRGTTLLTALHELGHSFDDQEKMIQEIRSGNPFPAERRANQWALKYLKKYSPQAKDDYLRQANDGFKTYKITTLLDALKKPGTADYINEAFERQVSDSMPLSEMRKAQSRILANYIKTFFDKSEIREIFKRGKSRPDYRQTILSPIAADGFIPRGEKYPSHRSWLKATGSGLQALEGLPTRFGEVTKQRFLDVDLKQLDSIKSNYDSLPSLADSVKSIYAYGQFKAAGKVPNYADESRSTVGEDFGEFAPSLAKALTQTKRQDLIPNKRGEMSAVRFNKYIYSRLPAAEKEMLQSIGIDKLIAGKNTINVNEIYQHLKTNAPRIEVAKLGAGVQSKLSTDYYNLYHQLETKGILPRFGLVDEKEVIVGFRYEGKPVKVEDMQGPYAQQMVKLQELYKLKIKEDNEILLAKSPESATARYTVVNPKPLKELTSAVDLLIRTRTTEYSDDELRALNIPIMTKRKSEKYRSPHYPNEGVNLVAHVRGNFEELPNKKKAFHVFEVQSDWAQHVREIKADQPQITERGGSYYVNEPDSPQWRAAGPFTKIEAEEVSKGIIQSRLDGKDDPTLRMYEHLGLKAAIKHAVAGGADYLAISDGNTAMLTEGHDRAAVTVMTPTPANIQRLKREGNFDRLLDKLALNKPVKLDKYEIDEYRSKGYDLQTVISQEAGMRLHYDKILPNIAEKLTGSKPTSVSFGEHQNVLRGETLGGDESTTNQLRNDLVIKDSRTGEFQTDIRARLFSLEKIKKKLRTGEPFSTYSPAFAAGMVPIPNFANEAPFELRRISKFPYIDSFRNKPIFGFKDYDFDNSIIDSAFSGKKQQYLKRGRYKNLRRTALETTGEQAFGSDGLIPNYAEFPEEVLQAVRNSGGTFENNTFTLKLWRAQRPEQGLMESVRGGVFYLPFDSKDKRHYRGKSFYGGEEQIRAIRSFKSPYFVKGGTGGISIERAFQQTFGSQKVKELQEDVAQVTGGYRLFGRQNVDLEGVQQFLKKYAPEKGESKSFAQYLVENSKEGNRLKTAARELAIGEAFKTVGHDAIISYNKNRVRQPMLREIFALNEHQYPFRSDFAAGLVPIPTLKTVGGRGVKDYAEPILEFTQSFFSTRRPERDLTFRGPPKNRRTAAETTGEQAFEKRPLAMGLIPNYAKTFYHGTGFKDYGPRGEPFTEFSADIAQEERGAIYFGLTPAIARTFTLYKKNPRIIEAQLDIRKPFVLKNREHREQLMAVLAPAAPVIDHIASGQLSHESRRKLNNLPTGLKDYYGNEISLNPYRIFDSTRELQRLTNYTRRGKYGQDLFRKFRGIKDANFGYFESEIGFAKHPYLPDVSDIPDKLVSSDYLHKTLSLFQNVEPAQADALNHLVKLVSPDTSKLTPEQFTRLAKYNRTEKTAPRRINDLIFGLGFDSYLPIEDDFWVEMATRDEQTAKKGLGPLRSIAVQDPKRIKILRERRLNEYASGLVPNFSQSKVFIPAIKASPRAGISYSTQPETYFRGDDSTRPMFSIVDDRRIRRQNQEVIRRYILGKMKTIRRSAAETTGEEAFRTSQPVNYAGGKIPKGFSTREVMFPTIYGEPIFEFDRPPSIDPIRSDYFREYLRSKKAIRRSALETTGDQAFGLDLDRLRAEGNVPKNTGPRYINFPSFVTTDQEGLTLKEPFFQFDRESFSFGGRQYKYRQALKTPSKNSRTAAETTGEQAFGKPEFIGHLFAGGFKPKINEIGEKLASEYNLVKGTRAYNQFVDNCYNIATKVAADYGYATPKTKDEAVAQLMEIRSARVFGGDFPKPSPANLVVRAPDNPTNLHVAFEYKNKEVNFGPGKREGFEITDRIPLRKLRSGGLVPSFAAPPLRAVINMIKDSPSKITREDGGSYYSPFENKVNISRGASLGSIAHELGHSLDDTQLNIQELVQNKSRIPAEVRANRIAFQYIKKDSPQFASDFIRRRTEDLKTYKILELSQKIVPAKDLLELNKELKTLESKYHSNPSLENSNAIKTRVAELLRGQIQEIGPKRVSRFIKQVKKYSPAEFAETLGSPAYAAGLVPTYPSLLKKEVVGRSVFGPGLIPNPVPQIVRGTKNTSQVYRMDVNNVGLAKLVREEPRIFTELQKAAPFRHPLFLDENFVPVSENAQPVYATLTGLRKLSHRLDDPLYVRSAVRHFFTGDERREQLKIADVAHAQDKRVFTAIQNRILNPRESEKVLISGEKDIFATNENLAFQGRGIRAYVPPFERLGRTPIDRYGESELNRYLIKRNIKEIGYSTHINKLVNLVNQVASPSPSLDNANLKFVYSERELYAGNRPADGLYHHDSDLIEVKRIGDISREKGVLAHEIGHLLDLSPSSRFYESAGIQRSDVVKALRRDTKRFGKSPFSIFVPHNVSQDFPKGFYETREQKDREAIAEIFRYSGFVEDGKINKYIQSGEAPDIIMSAVKRILDKSNAASGLIPNIVNPKPALIAAYNREVAAGVPKHLIRVGKLPSLQCQLNPEGYGIYNLRDEPQGLIQGVNRVLRQGQNPKTAGLANGFIPKPPMVDLKSVPNFAPRLEVQEGAYSSPEAEARAIERAIEAYNKLKGIRKSGSGIGDLQQAARQIAEQFKLTEQSVQNMVRGFKNIEAGFFRPGQSAPVRRITELPEKASQGVEVFRGIPNRPNPFFNLRTSELILRGNLLNPARVQSENPLADYPQIKGATGNKENDIFVENAVKSQLKEIRQKAVSGELSGAEIATRFDALLITELDERSKQYLKKVRDKLVKAQGVTLPSSGVPVTLGLRNAETNAELENRRKTVINVTEQARQSFTRRVEALEENLRSGSFLGLRLGRDRSELDKLSKIDPTIRTRLDLAASQGQSRLSQIGFTASFVAPQLAGVASTLIGDQSRERRVAGAALEGVGDVASFAGLGLSLFPNPLGLGLGAAVGAITGISRVVSAFTDQLPELQKELEKTTSRVTEFQSSFQNYTISLERLQQGLSDTSGRIKPEDVVKRQQNVTNDLIRIPEEFRAKVAAAAGDAEKIKEAFAEINRDLTRKAEGAEAAVRFAQAYQDSSFFSSQVFDGSPKGTKAFQDVVRSLTGLVDTSKFKPEDFERLSSESRVSGIFALAGDRTKLSNTLKEVKIPEEVIKQIERYNNIDLAKLASAFSRLIRETGNTRDLVSIQAEQLRRNKELHDQFASNIQSLNRQLEATNLSVANRVQTAQIAIAGRTELEFGRQAGERNFAFSRSQNALEENRAFLTPARSAQVEGDLKIAQLSARRLDALSSLIANAQRDFLQSIAEQVLKRGQSLSTIFSQRELGKSLSTPEKNRAAIEARAEQALSGVFADFGRIIAQNPNAAFAVDQDQLTSSLRRAGVPETEITEIAASTTRTLTQLSVEIAKVTQEFDIQTRITREQNTLAQKLVEQQRRLAVGGGAQDFIGGSQLRGRFTDIIQSNVKGLVSPDSLRSINLGRGSFQLADLLVNQFGIKPTQLPDSLVARSITGSRDDLLSKIDRVENITRILSPRDFNPQPFDELRQNADEIAVDQVASQLHLEELPKNIANINDRIQTLVNIMTYQSANLQESNKNAFTESLRAANVDQVAGKLDSVRQAIEESARIREQIETDTKLFQERLNQQSAKNEVDTVSTRSRQVTKDVFDQTIAIVQKSGGPAAQVQELVDKINFLRVPAELGATPLKETVNELQRLIQPAIKREQFARPEEVSDTPRGRLQPRTSTGFIAPAVLPDFAKVSKEAEALDTERFKAQKDLEKATQAAEQRAKDIVRSATTTPAYSGPSGASTVATTPLPAITVRTFSDPTFQGEFARIASVRDQVGADEIAKDLGFERKQLTDILSKLNDELSGITSRTQELGEPLPRKDRAGLEQERSFYQRELSRNERDQLILENIKQGLPKQAFNIDEYRRRIDAQTTQVKREFSSGRQDPATLSLAAGQFRREDTLKLEDQLAAAKAELLLLKAAGHSFSEELRAAADHAAELKIRLGEAFGVTDGLRTFFDQWTYSTQDFYRDIKNGAVEAGQAMKASFSDAWKSFARGQLSAGEALREFALNFSYKLLDKSIDVASNFAFAGLGKVASGIGNYFSNSGSTFARGGVVKGYTSGGKVQGGSGVRDDVPAMLQAGEYVLRKSAVQAIGVQKLDRLNYGGYVRKYATGGNVNLVLQNEYVYDDKFRPTKGEFKIDPRLSSFALDDENNPQNALRYQREQALAQYLKDKAAYDKQVKKALQQYKRQKDNALNAAFISAAINIGGAAVSQGLSPQGFSGGSALSSRGYSNLTPVQEGAAHVSTPSNLGGYTVPSNVRYGIGNYGSNFRTAPTYNNFGFPYRTGGLVKYYSAGGSVFGAESPKDTVPALLTGGEYVVRNDVVRRFGVPFFDSLNRGEVSRFADGGFVGTQTTQAPAQSDLSAMVKSLQETIEQLRVSLANAKTKPEEQEQAAGGNVYITNTFNVQNGDVRTESDATTDDTSGRTKPENLKKLMELINTQTRQIIIQEKRPNGLLDPRA